MNDPDYVMWINEETSSLFSGKINWIWRKDYLHSQNTEFIILIILEEGL